MNKGIKNTDNYFERVKQRANRTNYRYYFFGLPIFQGRGLGQEDRADVRFYTAVLVLVVGSSSARQLSPD